MQRGGIENGVRTGEISSVAVSLDGGQKGSQEAGGFTDACDVGLGASAGTNSSECGTELSIGSQSGKSLLYMEQIDSQRSWEWQIIER